MKDIVAAIVKQIESEAATQKRLSDEYAQRYNILRYYTPSIFGESDLQKSLGNSIINAYNLDKGVNMRPGNLGDLGDMWFAGYEAEGLGRWAKGRRRGHGRGRPPKRRGRGPCSHLPRGPARRNCRIRLGLI